MTLLETVGLPKEGAVVPLKGHQKDMTLESKGNNLADIQLSRQHKINKLNSYASLNSNKARNSCLFRSRNSQSPGMRIYKISTGLAS